MTTTRPGIHSISDLKYFVSVETYFVILGTAVLAVLEGNLIPKSWVFYDWVTDWKILLLIGAILLIALPPTLAKGVLHLRSRDSNAKKNAELSAALTAIHSRTSNLVSKVKESERGEVTNTYRNHSIRECQSYFASRRTVGGRSVDHSGVYIEVVYYELTVRQGGSKLERKYWTSDNPFTLNGTLSSRGSSKSKAVVERIARGEAIWEDDFADSDAAEAFGVTAANASNFVIALGVPILRDRTGEDGIAGMLLVTSSDHDALVRTDEALVRAYAWFLSVAMVLDSRTSPKENVVVST